MKLALLMCLTADRRAGVPVSDLEPYDQAVRRFKDLVQVGVAPVPEYPLLALWTTGGEVKSNKFKIAPEGDGKTVDKGVRKKLGDHSRLKTLQKELTESRDLLEMAEVERDTVISERDAAVKAAEEMKVRLESALAERLVQSAPGAGGESGGSATVPPVVPPTSLGPAPAPAPTSPASSEPPKTG